MTCEDIELRLYDEDCRAALHGRKNVPADVASHTARCESCRKVWIEATGDTRRVAECLLAESPVELRAALYVSYRAARPLPARDWAAVLSSAVVGGALGGSLLPALPGPLAVPPGAGLCIGSAFGVAVHALNSAGIDWSSPRMPWHFVVERWLPRLIRMGG